MRQWRVPRFGAADAKRWSNCCLCRRSSAFSLSGTHSGTTRRIQRIFCVVLPILGPIGAKLHAVVAPAHYLRRSPCARLLHTSRQDAEPQPTWREHRPSERCQEASETHKRVQGFLPCHGFTCSCRSKLRQPAAQIRLLPQFQVAACAVLSVSQGNAPKMKHSP